MFRSKKLRIAIGAVILLLVLPVLIAMRNGQSSTSSDVVSGDGKLAFARLFNNAGSSETTGQARPSAQDRDAQKQEAIKKQDPALLPVCTDEELSNRSDPVPARSLDPWEHLDQLGCHLKPPTDEQKILGPSGGPAADHAEANKWWLGVYRLSPSTYATGVGARMNIVNPGVDHSTTDDFYASRVLIKGSNGHRLEGGWFEGAFNTDVYRHIYYQNSHQCTGPDSCY